MHGLIWPPPSRSGHHWPNLAIPAAAGPSRRQSDLAAPPIRPCGQIYGHTARFNYGRPVRPLDDLIYIYIYPISTSTKVSQSTANSDMSTGRVSTESGLPIHVPSNARPGYLFPSKWPAQYSSSLCYSVRPPQFLRLDRPLPTPLCSCMR